MDRETLSWILIGLAVLLAAAAVSIWAYAVETVTAGGGESLLVHSTTKIAIAFGGLALVAAAAGLLARIERRPRLPQPGRCVCGYPLDEKMGRCPECGRVRWRS